MKTTATVKYLSHLRTEATHTATGLKIVNDAPVDNNGKGAAFSPTDMVATALATCMITVMAIRAEKEGWDFDATADINKIMGNSPRRIAEVQLNLKCKVSGGALAGQLLEKVGKACPVAKSLSADLMQTVKIEWS